MLCYVVSKREYEYAMQCLEKGFKDKVEINHVFIGSVKDLNEAWNLAKTLPCIAEVKLDDRIAPVCYILCTP